KRLKDFPFAEDVERLSGDAAHDFAEELEVDVAVAEDVARSVDRLLFHEELHRRVVAAPRIVEIEVRPQSRGVREQMANRHVGMTKLRDELLHRIVETNLS